MATLMGRNYLPCPFHAQSAGILNLFSRTSWATRVTFMIPHVRSHTSSVTLVALNYRFHCEHTAPFLPPVHRRLAARTTRPESKQTHGGRR